MIKFWNKSILIGTILLLILAGCGKSSETSSKQNGDAQKEMDVRISYNLPAEHSTGIYFEELANEIKKNTANTSIKLNPQTFPNGQLYNDQQLPDAVSNGAVEIGQLNVGFLAGEDAEPLRIVDLPFLFDSWEAEWAAEDGEYGKLFGKQLEKYNMKMIGFAQYGTVELYANKTIKLPENLKGLKMRAFGKGNALMLEEIGASPVSMSSQEVYQAMQQGTIDGYSTGPSSVVDRGLTEVTKYGTDMQIHYLPFQSVVNMDWWNKLPEDVQNAVLKASETAQKASREKAKSDAEEYLQKLSAKGLELYKPSAEDRKKWVDSVKGRYDYYLKKSGDMGKQLYDAAQKAN
ncbi:TRAP transporter substrate-binding protein [Neobacillus sp. GCM10023253]|uniref:TRAP transporter substrate-binding protein n=1 Tax=Neobacillus sp. GCM10023253 TaxID=3252644 RepID=UPI0036245179